MILRYLASFFGICPLPAQTKGQAADFSFGGREAVVVIHGLFRNRANMGYLQQKLNDAGYDVFNVDYPSRTNGIMELISHVAPDIDRYIEQYDRVHFIGHSMGGLMIRAYLKNRRPKNLGRVVMLGTPNHGSGIADAYLRVFFMRKLLGPALRDLRTTENLAEKLGTLDGVEVGIIAGTRVIDHINGWHVRKKPNDGKVTVESTHLEGEKDHLTLHTAHELMPLNDTIIGQAVAFFRNGRFN